MVIFSGHEDWDSEMHWHIMTEAMRLRRVSSRHRRSYASPAASAKEVSLSGRQVDSACSAAYWCCTGFSCRPTSHGWMRDECFALYSLELTHHECFVCLRSVSVWKELSLGLDDGDCKLVWDAECFMWFLMSSLLSSTTKVDIGVRKVK